METQTENKTPDNDIGNSNGLNSSQATAAIGTAAQKQKQKFFTTRNLTVTAVLSAISFVLYAFLKFPLPFIFPGFLEMQFSDMPALIGGFMMGPLSGCVIIIIRTLLKLPFTTTSGVGELGDLIMGLTYVLVSSFIYKKHRTKKGALLGLTLGSVANIAAALLINAFILIPFYANLYGWNFIIGAMTNLFPSISQSDFYLFYLPISVLPFNILRCIICALITFFLYKSLHKLINSMFKPKKKI